MGQADRRAGIWYDRLDRFRAEMALLREIALESELAETFKWRQPCYTHAGANVAIASVTRTHCGLGFFQGAVLADPAGLLHAPGPNSRHAQRLEFTTLADITAARPAITALIEAAIARRALGRFTVSTPTEPVLPAEMTAALDADAALDAAWRALTPGRRRGWAIRISGAAQAATRASRMDRARAAILAGRGPHDR